MAARDLFDRREIAFLKALIDGDVEFMIVGLAAAALQGAPAVTQDIDLWFAKLGSDKMLRALERAGVTYIAPTDTNPPLLAGGGADLFDIVVHMHGLSSFEEEAGRVTHVKLGELNVPVLPISRIIASKEATGREKDRAILPVLRDSLRVLESLEEEADS